MPSALRLEKDDRGRCGQPGRSVSADRLQKSGSKKRLVQDFLGWLGAESLAAVAQELRLRGAEEEIPLAAAKSGIEVLYEGFAVGAPVQRESWARFLFEKDAPAAARPCGLARFSPSSNLAREHR